MVKIIIHIAFILLFCVSVIINVVCFTGDTAEIDSLKNTIAELRETNNQLAGISEKFESANRELRIIKDELDRRAESARTFIRDAIRTTEELESEINKSGK